MTSVYRPLKEQIAKLQRTNESLSKEIAELRLSHAMSQEKSREFLDKLQANDQELIASLTENRNLTRKLQEIQQENAILHRNLKETEAFGKEISKKYQEKAESLENFKQILEEEARKRGSFEEKVASLQAQAEENARIFEENRGNLAFFADFAANLHEFLEDSLRKMLHFSVNMDGNSRLLQRNSQNSLDFIVKAQNYLSISKEKRENRLESLKDAFVFGISVYEQGLTESLEELSEEIAKTAKNSTLLEKTQREVQSLQREAVFKEEENKDLRRELQRTAQSKEIAEKDKEKSLNELQRLRKENQLIASEIASLKAEFDKTRLHLEKYQKANEKLLNFSETQAQVSQIPSKSLSFHGELFEKSLEFIENREIVLIFKEIFALEQAKLALFARKNALEQGLSALEIDYKAKLNSFVKETDPKLAQLRREIAQKREDFQRISLEMRENDAKKAKLLEELQINRRIASRYKDEAYKRRSFEEKSRNKSGNFKENCEKTAKSEKKNRFFQEFSHYETFKEMQREDFNEKMQFLSNKTAPTVIFSPTNETNVRIAKMLETDQKELQEKFSLWKKL